MDQDEVDQPRSSAHNSGVLRADRIDSTEENDPQGLEQASNFVLVPSKHHSFEKRWRKLDKYYNDQYLDLFNHNQQMNGGDSALDTSQIGSVTWNSGEKRVLFNTLARKGRHDLQALTDVVKSKSVIEINDYLHRLKAAADERQFFSQKARTLAHATIDAAIEIDPELDGLLDNAADALAAYQDYYDLSQTKIKHGEFWYIDTQRAQALENSIDAEDEAQEHDDQLMQRFVADDHDAIQMFHFDQLLDLSRNLFMNLPAHKLHGHWTEYTESDEEPAITLDAAREFHNLVKSLTQRVLQCAIFMAESRLRATATPGYTPAKVLRDIDIVAALQVLNMPTDSWDYWPNFVRRSEVRVVLGSRSGEKDTELSQKQIEDALSVRASRGRRRSLSSLVTMSSQDGTSGPEDEISGYGHDVDDNGSAVEGSSASPGGNSETTSNDNSSSSGSENGSHTLVTGHSGARLSRQGRRVMVEEEQDAFMERLDGISKAQEDARLRLLLELPNQHMGVHEKLAPQPKTRRKTQEELKDWSDMSYRSSWERKRSAAEAFENSPN